MSETRHVSFWKVTINDDVCRPVGPIDKNFATRELALEAIANFATTDACKRFMSVNLASIGQTELHTFGPNSRPPYPKIRKCETRIGSPITLEESGTRVVAPAEVRWYHEWTTDEAVTVEGKTFKRQETHTEEVRPWGALEYVTDGWGGKQIRPKMFACQFYLNHESIEIIESLSARAASAEGTD